MGRALFGALLALLLVTRPVLAAGVPANVSSAVSTVTQKKMLSLGVAADDTRFLSTLNGMTSVALGSAAGAGTALMVGGAVATAPAWLSVAATAGISALVGTAVTLGVSSLWNWAFGDSTSSTPVTVTVPAGSSPEGYPSSVAAIDFGAPTLGGGMVQALPTTIGGIVYCQDSIFPNASVPCAGDPWGALAGSYNVTAPNVSNGKYQLINCSSNGCDIQYYNNGWQTLGSVKIATKTGTVNCPAGDYYISGSTSCIPVPGATATAVSGSYSMNDAVNMLPSSEADQQVNPQIISAIADALWQKASQQPGYNGVPYPVSNPITAGDATTAKQGASSWPTVRDLVTASANSSTDFTVSTGSSTGTGTGSGTGTGTGTGTTTIQVTVNLGPDPGIASPTLESTPTMPQILGPILSLFSDVRAFQVPSHQGVCPRPTFAAFGRSFTIAAHCTLIEQQRSVIAGFMAVVWVLIGLMIVLKA